MKLRKKFFRRPGDRVSCREGKEILLLSDKTKIEITVELNFYPISKNFVWFVQLVTKDSFGSICYCWHAQPKGVWINKLLFRARYFKGDLLGRQYKHRQNVLNSWLKQSFK